MNLRKLLFALSTLTLVGTPVISIVSCSSASTSDTAVNLSNLKSLLVEEGDMSVNEPTAVTASEIKTIANKIITRAVNKLAGVKEAKVDTDFSYSIKTNTNTELVGPYDFATDDQAVRTFKVTVMPTSTTKKLTGTSGEITLILPKLQKKVDLAVVDIKLVTPPYSDPIAKPGNATGAEIITILQPIVKKALEQLEGVATVEEKKDYNFTVVDNTDVPVTNTSKTTYNFYDAENTNERTFKVTIESVETSKILKGKSEAKTITLNLVKKDLGN